MPDAYARTTIHGRPIDAATKAAVEALEADLGYPLTIMQGIGGASASAGTHTQGRAIDVDPWDIRRKLRLGLKHGFIGWYRPYVRGLWPAHGHMVLVLGSRDNQRGIAGSAFRQIGAYLRRSDGLISDHHDPNARPDLLVPFQFPPKEPPRPVYHTRITDALDLCVEASSLLGQAATKLEKAERPTRAGRLRMDALAATIRTARRSVRGVAQILARTPDAKKARRVNE
jgi:hypothetical protein